MARWLDRWGMELELKLELGMGMGMGLGTWTGGAADAGVATRHVADNEFPQ